MPAQLIHMQPDEGPAFSAVGDVYRILATGDQTGGAYALCEARVLPGGGPPPHIHHREDESFFVLEGEITFQLAGKKVVAKAGSFIQGPRGIPHAFKNESTVPARMLILCRRQASRSSSPSSPRRCRPSIRRPRR
ncbi:MAG: Quercetin 2,3-dioxygenase [Verrucomicrobiota bacterium]